ncbi:nephronectin-like [Oryzias latipes]
MDKMTDLMLQFLGVIGHLILFSVAHHQESFHRLLKDTLDPIQGHGQPGLCNYGWDISCCFGWRNVNGLCQPVCRKPCVNGKCVGPDKCSCFTGYRGPHCDEDVNECGLLERPCSQRCMNTPGSYRCYCESGYSLNADGYTCTKERDCFSMRCQFGCQFDRAGAARCLCPPGLRLAADSRTCEDVDECKEGDVCPSRQTCKNTFGSFVCVCAKGFVMATVKNSVECRDENECLTGSHTCSRHAWCVNMDGSYTCRCLGDFFGDGYTCWPRRIPQSRNIRYFNYKLSKRIKPIHSSL